MNTGIQFYISENVWDQFWDGLCTWKQWLETVCFHPQQPQDGALSSLLPSKHLKNSPAKTLCIFCKIATKTLMPNTIGWYIYMTISLLINFRSLWIYYIMGNKGLVLPDTFLTSSFLVAQLECNFHEIKSQDLCYYNFANYCSTWAGQVMHCDYTFLFM